MLVESTISQESLECSTCKGKLEAQRTLDGSEFSVLKADFRDMLEKGLEDRIVAANLGSLFGIMSIFYLNFN
jgi:hypothetical protein